MYLTMPLQNIISLHLSLEGSNFSVLRSNNQNYQVRVY